MLQYYLLTLTDLKNSPLHSLGPALLSSTIKLSEPAISCTCSKLPEDSKNPCSLNSNFFKIFFYLFKKKEDRGIG